ncbi:MAG: hypothetical protein ACXWTT_06405 [Methylobacter sp.]
MTSANMSSTSSQCASNCSRSLRGRAASRRLVALTRCVNGTGTLQQSWKIPTESTRADDDSYAYVE